MLRFCFSNRESAFNHYRVAKRACSLRRLGWKKLSLMALTSCGDSAGSQSNSASQVAKLALLSVIGCSCKVET